VTPPPSPAALGVLLAAGAGLSDLAGSILILSGRKWLGRQFDDLLAAGTGFALAIALAELIPAGLEGGPGNALWVLAGFALLYLVNTLLHGEDVRLSPAAPDETGASKATALATFGRAMPASLWLTMAGVIVCDYFDGLAVASAAFAGDGGRPAGWLLLGGLFPHNFLEGASIALLLVGGGMRRGLVWILVVLLAGASLLGGLTVLLAVPEDLRTTAQAFGGGLLLHLVATERLPQLSRRRPKRHALLVVAGVLAFAASRLLPGA
jgi:zinc transporter ZupT